MCIRDRLYALNMPKEKIIKTFYNVSQVTYDDNRKSWNLDFNPENFKRPIKLSFDLIDANNLKELISEVFLKREEEFINEIKQSNRGLVSSTKSLLKKVIKID